MLLNSSMINESYIPSALRYRPSVSCLQPSKCDVSALLVALFLYWPNTAWCQDFSGYIELKLS